MFGLLFTPAILAPGLALAHSPHDVVAAYAPADEDGVAWLVLTPRDLSQLLRSDDGGQHWDFVQSPTIVDEIVSLGQEGEILLALSAEGRLWRSVQAEEWHAVELPNLGEGRALLLGEGVDLIAGSNGVVQADLVGGSQELRLVTGESGGSALAIDPDDPERLLVGLDDGQVLLQEDRESGFLPLEPLPDGLVALSAALGPRYAWAGTDGGGTWRWDGEAWSPCADLPSTETGDYAQHVPALALGPGELVAATGHQALFRSDDDCDSWTLLEGPEPVAYGGMGFAEDPRQAFTWIGQTDDHWQVAGFGGLSYTDDDGAWTDAKLIPGDHVRGLAFSPDFPDDPRLWVGGYGGGLWWTWDGGAQWWSSATGIDRAWVYDLQPDPLVGEWDGLWMSASLEPYRSDDGGHSWQALEGQIPMKRVRAFQPWGDGICALGEELAGELYAGRVACSWDRGDSWQSQDELEALLGSAIPMSMDEVVIAGEPRLVVLADGPPSLLALEDDGWQVLARGEVEDEPVAGAATWPPGVGDTLIFASAEHGLLRSYNGAATWHQLSQVEGEVRRLTMADDGTLFIEVRSGQVLRSTDGGDSWQPMGSPLAAALHELVPGPRFAEHGLLLAATQDGVFWLDARQAAPTWQRLRRFERFEDGTYALACSGLRMEAGCSATVDLAQDCATWTDDQAGRGGGYLLGTGSTLRFSFTGTGFRPLVANWTAGHLGVWVGGEQVARIGAEDGWRVEGLAPGWKDVELVWEGSSPLYVDAVEAWGEGEVLPLDTVVTLPEEAQQVAGGCGSQAGVLLLLPLLGLGRRRRAQPPGSSTKTE